MPVMLSKTYQAFKASGIDEATAQAAAEELAGHESRLGKIESRLVMIQWITGLNFTGIVALVIKSFA